MNKNFRLLLMVACSSVASQIYFNMFIDGFIVSLSVAMMGIFLYIFKDLNSLLACTLIGICSPGFRLIILLWQGTPFGTAIMLAAPDVAFFFAYAIIFSIILKKMTYSYTQFYIRLVISDFLSNCMEMSVRAMILHQNLDGGKISGLILLAFVRSFFILLIAISSDSYKSLLENKEHEDNYKKLLLMASTFNSEVYFMEKNMNEIEDVMRNAFLLYKTLEYRKYPKSLQHIALDISKDIHEIKKGYRRVIKGLQDNFLSEFKDTSLSLQDLLKILSVDVESHLKSKKMKISFDYNYQTNYIIANHFSFMSILRNLVSNSLDAFESSPQHSGYITVKCRDSIKNNQVFCVIVVSDNGPGIASDVIDVLFEPGFSTKFNEETGDINRGLGLTLVRDLLEEKFDGTISVNTALGQGTTFTLTIPADKLSLDEGSQS